MTQKQRASNKELMDIARYIDSEGFSALWAGLIALHEVQSVTSTLTDNCIPDEGSEPSSEQIRVYFLALQVEISELLQELNWKPWKESKPIDKARVIDEFADVLAFLGIIIVYMHRMGISMKTLAAGYAAKTKVNIDRFSGSVDGYRVRSSSEIEDDP